MQLRRGPRARSYISKTAVDSGKFIQLLKRKAVPSWQKATVSSSSAAAAEENEGIKAKQ